MDLQKPEWVDEDAEIALHQDIISLIPALNILSPRFHTFPIPTTLCNNPEPFYIVPIIMIENEAKVATNWSWYHHKFVDVPLFSERDLSWVQVLIGDHKYSKCTTTPHVLIRKEVFCSGLSFPYPPPPP